jgi:hypothetical protein
VEEASLAGDILLCKDLAIAHNSLEAQVVYMSSARVFGLSNASLAGPIMAQWYLDNEAKIVAAATKARGPYVALTACPSGSPRSTTCSRRANCSRISSGLGH